MNNDVVDTYIVGEESFVISINRWLQGVTDYITGYRLHPDDRTGTLIKEKTVDKVKVELDKAYKKYGKIYPRKVGI